jgi:hypothetical protein
LYRCTAERFEESDAMLQLAGKIGGVRSRPAADSKEYAAGVVAAAQTARELADALHIPLEVGVGTFHFTLFCSQVTCNEGALTSIRLPKTQYNTLPRGVALQVAFERQTLKPVFHSIGYRLWV